MSRDEYLELLQQLLPDRSSEAYQTAFRWLEEELNEGVLPEGHEAEAAHPREAGAARLRAAIDLGLEIYTSFNNGFNAFYLQPGPCVGRHGGPVGARYVRRALRHHFGFWTRSQVEAVLNRICDLRPRLLDNFCRKYQPSLFAARNFAPDRLGGYFVRVAWIESLHLPPEELASVVPLLNPEMLGCAAGLDGAADGAPSGPVQWAEQLATFWLAHGFRREHHLEALLSVGLGAFTGEPVLVERSRQFLAARLPAWEQVEDRLSQRAGQLLARREEIQEAIALTDPNDREALRARLDRVNVSLARQRARQAAHAARLRPRPAAVQKMLAGVVERKVGTLRFARIQREIDLLQRRVETGKTRLLSFAGHLPKGVTGLLDDVAAHLAQRPPSSRARRLSEQERMSRLDAEGRWRYAAAQVLERIRKERGQVLRCPLAAGLHQAVAGWLEDAEDLYEFGILAPKGVLAALGRRFGARLERLLRVDPAPAEGQRKPPRRSSPSAPGERPPQGV